MTTINAKNCTIIVVPPMPVDLKKLYDELHPPKPRPVSTDLVSGNLSRDEVDSLFKRLNEEIAKDGLCLAISPIPNLRVSAPSSPPPSEAERSSTIRNLGGGPGAAPNQPPPPLEEL